MCSQRYPLLCIVLIHCRANSRRHVKILLPSSGIMRRLAPTRPMLRKKANIRRCLHQYLRLRRIICSFSASEYLNTLTLRD